MKLKFCGLTRDADIAAANETMPDYIGFVFADSRRCVDDVRAAHLRAQLDPAIQAVGVFVDDSTQRIASLVQRGIIDVIQLHGDEDMAYIATLRTLTTAPIIKAVRVACADDILRAALQPVDFLLLDTFVLGVRGGSGQSFDWSVIPQITKPYFLAGGLDAQNIDKALQVGAYALDLSGGIETEGVKDAEKMRCIAARVRRNKQ